MSFPLAQRAHAASSLDDASSWASAPQGDEQVLDREQLADAMRRRRSVRTYANRPLPRDELAEVLRWSEAPIPSDAPSVVRQLVTVAAVEGLEPGVYDAELALIAPRDGDELAHDGGRVRGDRRLGPAQQLGELIAR